MDEEILEQRYQLAVQFVGRTKGLSNEQRLKAYGLFKQVTSGDCSGSRPFLFDPIGCAKYDAWKAVAGMTSADARHQYLAFAISCGWVDPSAAAGGNDTNTSQNDHDSSTAFGGDTEGDERVARVLEAIAAAAAKAALEGTGGGGGGGGGIGAMMGPVQSTMRVRV